MYRIVYVNPEGDYCIQDNPDYRVIPSSHTDLKRNGHKVICIVDHFRKVVLFQSADYDWHKDKVEQLMYDY